MSEVLHPSPKEVHIDFAQFYRWLTPTPGHVKFMCKTFGEEYITTNGSLFQKGHSFSCFFHIMNRGTFFFVKFLWVSVISLQYNKVLKWLFELLCTRSCFVISNDSLFSSMQGTYIRISSFIQCKGSKYYLDFFWNHFYVSNYWIRIRLELSGNLTIGNHLNNDSAICYLYLRSL